MWHMPCDTWHVTHETWLVVNTVSKCQVSSSNGLVFMALWIFGRKGWPTCNQWMNDQGVCRTAPATPSLLKTWQNLSDIFKIIITKILSNSQKLILNQFYQVKKNILPHGHYKQLGLVKNLSHQTSQGEKRHFPKKMVFLTIQLHLPFFSCNTVFSTPPSENQKTQHFRTP